MLLSCDELPHHREVAMVDGCFDPLHVGHVRYLQVAAELGLPLLCNVQDDAYIRRVKSRRPLLPEQQRVALVDALKPVAFTHLCRTSTHDVLARLRPRKYVKGMDWKSRGLPEEERDVCRRQETEIVYLDTKLDSSTNIVNQFLQGDPAMSAETSVTVQEFETMLFEQKEVKPDSYDHHYFQGDWRSGNNSYSVEARRVIEAKNPQNIKEVFNPRRVLDVGCGPGALMLFLQELGLDVWGVDISADARAAAPVPVRDRIHLAPVTSVHPFDKTFDLVVCREVLEHLTVLQVRQAVRTLAQYTSKFLYITTRYHPSPRGLLDVTNDFANDPTHITAMNKDLLRTLFLLEGLRSRRDLEAKMDWKNLGRVLVFERAS
jgi:cytidyltransferase-like protein